ncbi:helix-turn-helix domain-containing protein [Microbacterium sp. BG28]|uniref:helix-turn-helix domain-containing protein n=1 Tax=Microbacterium sp. BG28 TaxID=3097356 RepID=UPI0039B846DD
MARRIPQWTFGERLRKVRRELGLTQGDMAAQLGVGSPAYAAWESGRNQPADLPAVAVKLEHMSGVPRTWFLGWADESPRPDGPGGGMEWAPRGSNPRPAD